MKPFILYALEDEKIQKLLRNHLQSLDVYCESMDDGPYWTWHVLHEFLEGRETNFLIILWSADQIVHFQDRKALTTLDQLIDERTKQLGRSGIVSILSRPC